MANLFKPMKARSGLLRPETFNNLYANPAYQQALRQVEYGTTPQPVQFGAEYLGPLAQFVSALVGKNRIKKLEGQAYERQQERDSRAAKIFGADPTASFLAEDGDYRGASSVLQSNREYETGRQDRAEDVAYRNRTFGLQQQRLGLEFAKLSNDLDKGSDKDAFANADKLRDEFTKLSGEFIKVRDAWGRVQSVGREPTAAGDLALIFNYMKMLDPGSTVREGEFANAENSAGVPQRVRALFNKVVDGQRLSQEQRADFLSQAQNLYGAAEEQQRALSEQYTGLANRFGVSPENVVLDLYGPRQTEAAAQPAAQAQQPPQGIPTITTDDEFDALPPGTVFIGPDGKRRKK